RLVYGDALASEFRTEGKVPVVGSGGTSGSHNTANASGPTIVIGRKGSYGTIYWQPDDCFVIDTAYYVKSLVSDLDLRWLYYALQAVDLKGVSQDVGVPGLSRDDAHEVRIPATRLDEQRRIADFLDAETARIDQLVSLRSRQIIQLEERESAWRGHLFANSKSGIQLRVKHLLRAKLRYGVLVPEFVDEGVRFIRVNSITGLRNLDALPKIPEAISKRYARTITRPGDILLSVVGSMGKAAIVTDTLVGANVARAVAVIRLDPRNSPLLFTAWINTAEF